MEVIPPKSVLVPGAGGVPTVHVERGKTVIMTPGINNIEDKEVIDRIRRDPKFGTKNIREITPQDMKAMEIKQKKLKEAEEEIKNLKD